MTLLEWVGGFTSDIEMFWLLFRELRFVFIFERRFEERLEMRFEDLWALWDLVNFSIFVEEYLNVLFSLLIFERMRSMFIFLSSCLIFSVMSIPSISCRRRRGAGRFFGVFWSFWSSENRRSSCLLSSARR